MQRFIIIALSLLLAGCGGGTLVNAPVAPGQNGAYQAGIGINQQLEVYRLTGSVLGVGESVQQYSFEGRATTYRSYGSAYIAGGTSGKGFIRFKIEGITWTSEVTQTAEFTPLAKVGDSVLLKTSDSKAASLVAGDHVVFLCRVQAEFLEAVAGNEQPNLSKIVQEFDYCRMERPQFVPVQ